MSLPRQIITFASDTAGLEKSLRALQALCQVLAFYPRVLWLLIWGLGLWGLGLGGEERGRRGLVGAYGYRDGDGDLKGVIGGLLRARTQFAIGRRFLRFFRFVGCFEKAWESLRNEEGVEMLIGVGRSGFMGAYLGLESLTILDMMGVCSTPWAPRFVLEGNKLWFYSLVISLFGCIWELWHLDSTSKDTSLKDAEKKQEKDAIAHKRKMKRRRILYKFISDGADLFLPGAVTGWLVTDTGVVGIATLVSTVLSSRDIWERLRN